MRNLLCLATGLCLAAVVVSAQTPAPKAAEPKAMTLTATSANVNGAGESIEFVIQRWSTDADRDKLAVAWNPPPPPPAPAPRAGGDAGAAPAAGGRAGRGGGGGGGRGGGRGGGGADAAPKTPEALLAAALKDLPAAGYFWTSEVGGYVIRYATKVAGPAGTTRIILLTDKRLGTAKNNWKPDAPAAANAYEFSLIELRLPAKGEGDGKASISGKLELDAATKLLSIENYDAQPVTIRAVKVSS